MLPPSPLSVLYRERLLLPRVRVFLDCLLSHPVQASGPDFSGAGEWTLARLASAQRFERVECADRSASGRGQVLVRSQGATGVK